MALHLPLHLGEEYLALRRIIFRRVLGAGKAVLCRRMRMILRFAMAISMHGPCLTRLIDQYFSRLAQAIYLLKQLLLNANKSVSSDST